MNNSDLYLTKEQFVKLCIVCGYASERIAMAYVKDKDILTQLDFEQVHSINERKLHIQNKRHYRRRAVHPDRLLDELNQHPEPWNRIYDPRTDVLRNDSQEAKDEEENE